MTTRKTILMGLSALFALSGAAGAADYGPIYGGLLQSAPELVPVEIGTGWYLRVDGSYDFEQDYDGTIGVYSPFDEASVPQDELRLEDGFNVGGGFGYSLTEYLRADVTARYGKSDSESFTDLSGGCGVGTECDFRGSSDARTWELMANAYVDLGTFAGFTPYVGGGLGAVNVSYDDASGTFCASDFVDPATPGCGSLDLDGEDSWRFAYALSAGVAYSVNRSISVDLGYRYLNVEGGEMYNLPLDSEGLPGSSLTAEDDGFDRHTIMAGLRYSLW